MNDHPVVAQTEERGLENPEVGVSIPPDRAILLSDADVETIKQFCGPVDMLVEVTPRGPIEAHHS